MQEDVEIAVDVQMGKLQGPCQGKLEVRVVGGYEGRGRGARWETAREGGVVVDVKLEEMEQRVGKAGDRAVHVWKGVSQSLVEMGPYPGGGVPFSLPNMSSSGRPVSLQLGKGIYCSSPFASVICPDTVLVSLCIS